MTSVKCVKKLVIFFLVSSIEKSIEISNGPSGGFLRIDDPT